MSKINFKYEGLLNLSKLDNFKKEKLQKIRNGTALGMDNGGEKIKRIIQAEASSKLKIKNKSFLNFLSSKVFFKNKDKNPIVILGNRRLNKIFISQEYGGTITAKGKYLIVPFDNNKKRLSQRQLYNLLNSKDTFVRNVGGEKIVFSKSKGINNFKQSRRSKLNVKIGRNEAIPIAILKKKITLKKKTNIERLIINNYNLLVNSVKENIDLRD